MRKRALFLTAIIVLSLITFVGCKEQDAKRTVYDISLNLEQNILTGSQTVNYYNDTETAINCLKFNLFGNAFRKNAKYSPVSSAHLSQSYPHGLSYGDMQILEVTSGGQPLDFSVTGQDMNVLSVDLSDYVYPEERIKINIQFKLSLANVVARTGINDSTINLANFYPILCARDQKGFYECVYYDCGDPFYSDCADYNVSISLDENYVVASSGQKTDYVDGENVDTHVFKINNARSFAFVLSKNFKIITDQTTGVEINYYYYDDEKPVNSMDYAVKSINYFNQVFGKYPYPTYSVVQTEFCQGGMEFPALVMISDDLEELAYGEVIVHETAHQWWQTVVGNNEIEYGFLDEGLAEYSVVLFYENHPEYNLKRENMVKSAQDTFKIFCTVSDKLFGKVDTSMLRSLKDFGSEYEYVNMAYIKPCIMYDTLRTTIGDERFFGGLKRYFKEYKFKNATPDDLVGVFEKIGADSNGFFKSFFNGTAII